MTIIKKQSKPDVNKEVTFIGIKVPKEVASFLLLYCLSKGITKSYIIKKLLNTWKDEQEKVVTEETILNDIIEKSFEGWRNRTSRKMTFYSFCYALRIELKRKGLDQELIDVIIKRLINEKDKKC